MSDRAQQANLAIYEDDLDAIRDAVRALGGTKIVGHLLRPEMAPDQAGAWLKDCLNAERREKLSMAQILKVLRLAHDTGYHSPVQYLASEMGYAVTPIEPEDEYHALQRTFTESVKLQRQIMERMERMTHAPLAVVKSHA